MIDFSYRHDQLLEKNPLEKAKYELAYAELSQTLSEALQSTVYLHKHLEFESGSKKDDLYFSFLMLVMDFIEALDSVHLLVKHGASSGCAPLLRTAIELFFGLKYMSYEKSEFKNRSLAYEYWHFRQKADWIEKCDVNTPVGKALNTKLSDDKIPDIFDASKYGVNPDAERDKLKKIMLSKRYEEVHNSYENMKSEKKKAKYWYSLFDGPHTIELLAFRINEASTYEALYRIYSSHVHGSKSLERLDNKNKDVPKILPIRSPVDLQIVVIHACNLTQAVNSVMVEKFLPAKEEFFRNDYTFRLREKLHKITKYNFTR